MIKNRWVDGDAEACIKRHANIGIDKDLAIRVYTSQLIGSDPQLVMHGGGNTSCKTLLTDLFGEKHKVICINIFPNIISTEIPNNYVHYPLSCLGDANEYHYEFINALIMHYTHCIQIS